MLFPKNTFVGKFLSKEQLYKRDIIGGTLKQLLIDDVVKITIEYNLSDRTLNVERGTDFPEITVLKIILKHQDYNEKLLNALDKAIPSSYVLFVLEYNQAQLLSIAFKEKNTSINIAKRWNTDWANLHNIKIIGTNIDQIYRNFIEQISNGNVCGANTEQLKNSVNADIERTRILKQIGQLESKMRAETQLNKQIEIKHKITELKGKING